MAAAVLPYAVKRLGSRALQRPQRNYTAAADNIPGDQTVWPTSSSRSSACHGAQISSTKIFHSIASPYLDEFVVTFINNLILVDIMLLTPFLNIYGF